MSVRRKVKSSIKVLLKKDVGKAIGDEKLEKEGAAEKSCF